MLQILPIASKAPWQEHKTHLSLRTWKIAKDKNKKLFNKVCEIELIWKTTNQ